MHREFGIIHSYTLEISFCGATQGVLKDTHFSQKVLKDMKKEYNLSEEEARDLQQKMYQVDGYFILLI